MIEGIAEIMRFLGAQKEACTQEAMKLIQDDAPKNKFSVVTGKYLAYQAVEEEIVNLERQREKS